VRSVLELRSPSNGTGWAEAWSFSGADDRLLRECLRSLDECATAPPREGRDPRRGRHVIDDEDRWRAAMLLWADERAERRARLAPLQADEAWTIEGALQLAEILPERLSDLRAAILARFSPR